MTTSSGILESYLLEAFKQKKELGRGALSDRADELLKHNQSQKGGDFLTPLSFYLDILGKTDRVMLDYIVKVEDKKKELEHNLQIAYLLLLAEKQYELAYQKTENEKIYDSKIKRCEELLDALNFEIKAKSPEQDYGVDGKPVKYCCIELAKEFAAKLVEMADRKSKTLKEALGALNEKRLYWVWGSVFLKTVLSALPDNFFNNKQAGESIKTPDPYTGTLSWALYYFRFSLNLFLLLKHTIKGPWMEKDSPEWNMKWYERFQTEWSARKFALLNDSLWGTSNLLSFFWLNGKGALGTWGDAVTIVLLVFDISVALWDFAEQQTQYNKQMLQYQTDIDTLTRTKEEFASIAQEDERKKKEFQIQMQINSLIRAQDKCAMEWKFKKVALFTNIAYAIALTGSFILLTMPFIPVTAALALSLGIAGAVLCFAFTVISNAIRGGIEIHKARHELKHIKEDFQLQVGELKKRLLKGDLTEDEKKLFYLEIKQLGAETEYQKQIVILQSVHLVRSMIFEALLPAVIFACLVFLPLGIGLGALAGALALAVVSNILINALLKPDEKMKELPPFDEKEYTGFCRAVAKKEDNSKELFSFFKQKGADKASKNNPETDPLLGASDPNFDYL